MTRKKQKTPQAEEYSYHVHYSPEDRCFIGQVDEFPGLSACGETLESALREIRVVVTEGISLLLERGHPVPEPLSRHQFTGELQLKIAPAVHRNLALEATRRGVSLDQLIRSKLATA